MHHGDSTLRVMGRKREIGSRSATQTTLRLPEELRKQVIDAADLNGRSQNTEIIMRLEDSFAPPRAADNGRTMAVSMNEIQGELAAIRREMINIKELLLSRK